MKKTLSLFLAVLMVLTVFMAVPVSAADTNPSAIKTFNNNTTEAFYPKKTEITQIIFANLSAGISVPAEYWDVSEEGDGSVKAWITEQDETIILYIAGEGGVKASVVSANLFDGFTALKEVSNLEHFHTDDVITMREMFYGCSSLEKIDMSSLNIGKVTTMERMFRGCTSLETVYMNNWNLHADLANMNGMFYGCTALSDIYIYDITMSGSCKPSQDSMYEGAGSAGKYIEEGITIKFHDNNNIGENSIPWKKLFSEAKGSVLVFDTPASYKIVPAAASLDMLTGQRFTLSVDILPRPTNSTVTWKSSDRSVATVTKDGIVTAVGASQVVDGVAKETIITITNTTVDGKVTKVDTIEVPVIVTDPQPEDCYEITFVKPDDIEYFSVSRDGGESFIPVYGGTFRYLKETELFIRANGNAMSYVFMIDGKDIESDYSNRLTLVVNKSKTVSVRTIALPNGEETLTIFEQIAKFFRDIIEWFRNLFG